jgi:hypothetical protein
VARQVIRDFEFLSSDALVRSPLPFVVYTITKAVFPQAQGQRRVIKFNALLTTYELVLKGNASFAIASVL